MENLPVEMYASLSEFLQALTELTELATEALKKEIAKKEKK